MKSLRAFSVTLILAIATPVLFAQNSNFSEKHKGKFKIPGASVKSLKKNPLFVNSYRVYQATTMKNSNIKHGEAAVHAEVALTGINKAAYQKVVNELHNDLIEKLKNAGFNVTNGEAFMNSPLVQKKKENPGKKDDVGNTGMAEPIPGKNIIKDGAWHGYRVLFVTRDLLFKPQNTNVFTTENIIKLGNFLQKPSTKESTNLLSVTYTVTYASFDKGRGYKSVNISVNPVLAVAVSITLVTPNGAYNKVYYEKLPVWLTGDWTEGVFKTAERNGEFWGLSNSADFEINARSDEYLAELKKTIEAIQTDFVNGIAANLK